MGQPKRKNKWTSREIKELQQLFPTASSKELALILPRHTVSSIKATAYALGLKRLRHGNPKWAEVVRNHVPVFEFARVVYD